MFFLCSMMSAEEIMGTIFVWLGLPMIFLIGIILLNNGSFFFH